MQVYFFGTKVDLCKLEYKGCSHLLDLSDLVAVRSLGIGEARAIVIIITFCFAASDPKP